MIGGLFYCGCMKKCRGRLSWKWLVLGRSRYFIKKIRFDFTGVEGKEIDLSVLR